MPALALLPLVALLGAAAPAYEIDVSDVSSAPDACPAREQVAEALDAHMPGVVARGGRATGPGLLHLSLAITSDGLARVTMTDATGALRLERELDLASSAGTPGRDRSVPRDRSSCMAVAETVTLIIERYMRHLGYHEPPPPVLVAPPEPPPPAAAAPPPEGPEQGRIGLGVLYRPPYGGPSRLEPTLTGALRIGRLEIGLSVGATWPIRRTIPMSGAAAGSFTLLSFPARLAVGVPIALGSTLTLVPGVAGGIDFVVAETKGIGTTRRSSAVEPVAEAGLTLRAALTRRSWLEVQAFQGIDLRPEEFFVSDPNTSRSVTILMTPRTYTRLGANFGFFLGKLGKN